MQYNIDPLLRKCYGKEHMAQFKQMTKLTCKGGYITPN